MVIENYTKITNGLFDRIIVSTQTVLQYINYIIGMSIGSIHTL